MKFRVEAGPAPRICIPREVISMFVSTRSLFLPGGQSECVETSSPRPRENHQGTNKSGLSARPSLAAQRPKTFPPRLQFRCSAPPQHLFLTPARRVGSEPPLLSVFVWPLSSVASIPHLYGGESKWKRCGSHGRLTLPNFFLPSFRRLYHRLPLLLTPCSLEEKKLTRTMPLKPDHYRRHKKISKSASSVLFRNPKVMFSPNLFAVGKLKQRRYLARARVIAAIIRVA